MKLKAILSVFVAILMTFSTASVVFAAEVFDTSSQFGDILYSNEGITVFYGNPADNEELAKKIENQYTRSLMYDYIWVDAYTTATRYAYITASSSNPITYFTVRQESDSEVTRSRVRVTRPGDDGTCSVSIVLCSLDAS